MGCVWAAAVGSIVLRCRSSSQPPLSFSRPAAVSPWKGRGGREARRERRAQGESAVGCARVIFPSSPLPSSLPFSLSLCLSFLYFADCKLIVSYRRQEVLNAHRARLMDAPPAGRHQRCGGCHELVDMQPSPAGRGSSEWSVPDVTLVLVQRDARAPRAAESSQGSTSVLYTTRALMGARLCCTRLRQGRSEEERPAQPVGVATCEARATRRDGMYGDEGDLTSPAYPRLCQHLVLWGGADRCSAFRGRSVELSACQCLRYCPSLPRVSCSRGSSCWSWEEWS